MLFEQRLWAGLAELLGLTESLEVGYRLSPRGRALLERLGPSGPAAPSADGGGSVP